MKTILACAIVAQLSVTAWAAGPRARFVQPKPGRWTVTLRYGQDLVLPRGTMVGDGSHAIEPIRFTRRGNPVFDIGGQVYVGKDTILSVERAAPRGPNHVPIKLGSNKTVKLGLNEELVLARGMRIFTMESEIKPDRFDHGRPVFKGLGGQYYVGRGDTPMTARNTSILTVER